MRLTKLFLAPALAFATLAFPLSARAQVAQFYPTVLNANNGQTNSLAAASTNTAFMPVIGSGAPMVPVPSSIVLTNSHEQVKSDFDYIGFQVTQSAANVTNAAATPSVVIYRFQVSDDSGFSYESTPSLAAVAPLSSAGTNTYQTNFFLPTSSHINLCEIDNTNSFAVSNITARFYLLSVKRGAVQSSQ